MSEQANLDYNLLKRLQAEVGELRREDKDRRRAANEPELSGEDARQHGKALVQEVVTRYESTLAETGREPLRWEARQDLVDALEARLFGAGSLQTLLEDDEIEDIHINGFRKVFAEFTDGTKRRRRPVCGSNEELIETISNLAAHEGLSARAFDAVNCRINLRLADGSRLYAVQGTTKEPMAAIRKHRFVKTNLKEQIALDTVTPALAECEAAMVKAGKNLMIAGEVGAGKTTHLRALASEIPAGERLITVERTLELGLDEDEEAHPDCFAMEERLPNAEGVGAQTMKQLVQDTLRMKPDRVIVGEVLGDEVITMLNAMTQGNDGSLSTIHANSARDVVEKITTYAAQAPERLPREAVLRLIASGLDFIIFMRRIRGEGHQRRMVAEVIEIAGINEDGELLTNEIWTLNSDKSQIVRKPGVRPKCDEDLRAAGWNDDESGYEQPGQGWV